MDAHPTARICRWRPRESGRELFVQGGGLIAGARRRCRWKRRVLRPPQVPTSHIVEGGRENDARIVVVGGRAGTPIPRLGFVDGARENRAGNYLSRAADLLRCLLCASEAGD